MRFRRPDPEAPTAVELGENAGIIPTRLDRGMDSSRFSALAGAVFGFVGVAAGAIGAHALRARLAPDLMTVYQTAAHYQMIHALALLFVSSAQQRWPGRAARIAAGCFIVGILLFSGSLYALALGAPRIIGFATPFGGLCFLSGWVATAVAAVGGTGRSAAGG